MKKLLFFAAVTLMGCNSHDDIMLMHERQSQRNIDSIAWYTPKEKKTNNSFYISGMVQVEDGDINYCYGLDSITNINANEFTLWLQGHNQKIKYNQMTLNLNAVSYKRK